MSFGGSAPSPAPPPAAPKEQEKTVENAANAEKVRLMRAMGRQATVMTNQAGASGGSKTTLG